MEEFLVGLLQVYISYALFWQSVLGYELRKQGAPHNCLDDACAAMKLALAMIEKGVDYEFPVIWTDVKEVRRYLFQLWNFASFGPHQFIKFVNFFFLYCRFQKMKWQSYFFITYQIRSPWKNYMYSFLKTLKLKLR